MTAAPRTDLLTAADLSHEPEDGLRRELHDGVVYVTPPPSAHHSRAVLAGSRTSGGSTSSTGTVRDWRPSS